MISIYTDASVSGTQNAASSCMILQDNTFIGHKAFTGCPGKTSLYAEVWGAIQAVKFAKETCSNFESEKVVLYTDAIGVLDSQKMPHTNTAEQLKLDRELQKILRECKVTVKLIRGHQYTNNPNKFVDYLAGKTSKGI